MHSSTTSHLATETALLDTLYTRSKHQHRSQVFLRHLKAVRRHARNLLAALSSDSDTRVLVRRLVRALIDAAAASNAVLAHHHFVPLHTLLLAAYARIFAVSLGVAESLGINVLEEPVQPKDQRRASTARPAPLPDSSASTRDLGRPVAGAPPVAAQKEVAPHAGRGSQDGTETRDQVRGSKAIGGHVKREVAGEVKDEDKVEDHKATSAKAKPKTKSLKTQSLKSSTLKSKPDKKKKRGAMDDIFGF